MIRKRQCIPGRLGFSNARTVAPGIESLRCGRPKDLSTISLSSSATPARPGSITTEAGPRRNARRARNELSFHCLRHTAVTLLKDAGIPEAVVMELVGHDSAQMSARCTHVRAKDWHPPAPRADCLAARKVCWESRGWMAKRKRPAFSCKSRSQRRPSPRLSA